MQPARQGLLFTLLAVCVTAGSANFLSRNLSAEPYFVDESANLAFAYWGRLMVRGEVDHPDWLHLGALERQPMGKYLTAAALWLGTPAGPPGDVYALESWHKGDRPPPLLTDLLPARWVSVLAGILTVLLLFVLGWQLSGPMVALGAAALLLASPLFLTHARRVMPDVPAQMFLLAALVAVAAVGHRLSVPARRPPKRPSTSRGPSRWNTFGLVLWAGVAAGLAGSCKLDAVLGFLILTGFLALAALALGLRAGWMVSGGLLSLVVGAAVFIAANPTFYAQVPTAALYQRAEQWQVHPSLDADLAAGYRRLAEAGIPQRILLTLEYRQQAMARGMEGHPDSALATVPQRLAAIVHHGFGRYSALGRFSEPGLNEKLAGGLMTALVALGLIGAWVEGRRQARAGQIPTRWLLLVWPILNLVMLLSMLQLDWDRYYLGLVLWSSVLAVYGPASMLRMIGRALVLAPPGGSDNPAADDEDDGGAEDAPDDAPSRVPPGHAPIPLADEPRATMAAGPAADVRPLTTDDVPPLPLADAGPPLAPSAEFTYRPSAAEHPPLPLADGPPPREASDG